MSVFGSCRFPPQSEVTLVRVALRCQATIVCLLENPHRWFVREQSTPTRQCKQSRQLKHGICVHSRYKLPPVNFLGSRLRRHYGCETLRKITTMPNPGSLVRSIAISSRRSSSKRQLGFRNLNISAFSNLPDTSPIRSKLSTMVSFDIASPASKFSFFVSTQNTCGLSTPS